MVNKVKVQLKFIFKYFLRLYLITQTYINKFDVFPGITTMIPSFLVWDLISIFLRLRNPVKGVIED